MIVNVTQEHIDKGSIHSAYSCPIALAVNATLSGANAVVFARCIGWSAKGVVDHHWHPSKEVYKFVRDFDAGQNVLPFSFEMKSVIPDLWEEP